MISVLTISIGCHRWRRTSTWNTEIRNARVIISACLEPDPSNYEFEKEEEMEMTRKTKVAGVPIRRGRDLNTGKGWRLVTPGERRTFKASLLKTLSIGGERIAIFRVLR
jgi:hypothetical protein